MAVNVNEGALEFIKFTSEAESTFTKKEPLG